MIFIGKIQVYTGNGKGKTTAALGLALRAAGRKKKTTIIQFMKKSVYGELIAVKNLLNDYVKIEQYGLKNFHTGNTVSKEETDAAEGGLSAAQRVIKNQEADILILDEINMALYFKLITLKDVQSLLEMKPPNMEIVLTGRNAHETIMDQADLVTEMKEIKHYYTTGLQAREGIEK